MNTFVQLVWAGIATGLLYAAIALGYTIVYNVRKVLNLAQGDITVLGALMAVFFVRSGFSLPVAIVFAILATVLAALIVSFLVDRVRPFSTHFAVIVTLGAGMAIRGVAMQIVGKSAVSLPAFSSQSTLSIGPITVSTQSLWVLGIVVVVFGALTWFFAASPMGKQMRAVADNPTAASLSGIGVFSMGAVAFAVAGIVGAVGGIAIAPMTAFAYTSGLILGIKGFVAMVIGGMGSLPGAVMGGLVLGLTESLAAGYVSSLYRDAIAGTLLLIILVFWPGGLFSQFEIAKR